MFMDLWIYGILRSYHVLANGDVEEPRCIFVASPTRAGTAATVLCLSLAHTYAVSRISPSRFGHSDTCL